MKPVIRYWKGQTGVNPIFGGVFVGKKLELTEEEAEKHKDNLSETDPLVKNTKQIKKG